MARRDGLLGRVLSAVAALAAWPVLAGSPGPAGLAPPPAYLALGRDVLKELVEINSTHAFGSTVAARAAAARFLAAGFPASDVRVLVPDGHPDKGNLVVRLRGTGKDKPVLYIGHLDVVEARREDWTYDPFRLTEADGWLYGRGTIDMKGQDAAMLAALVRLRQEGFRPRCDIIVAFTADEEAGGDYSGMQWLLDAPVDLLGFRLSDAALAINPDVGQAAERDGVKLFLGVQTSEKLYATFQIEASDHGGHSSRPTPDNPLNRIARALSRLAEYSFPIHLTDTTRAYLTRRAGLESGQVADDMRAAAAGTASPEALARLSADVDTNIVLRSTCVATQMTAGQSESALPQHARAVIQCRLVPGETVARTQATLTDVIDDPKIALSVADSYPPSPESPPSPRLLGAVEAVARDMWPGVAILPVMSAGASDSAITRGAGIPSYGVDGIFDSVGQSRAHGRDERVGVRAFGEELEFTYRLMKRLAS